jgi:hypothetical protein
VTVRANHVGNFFALRPNPALVLIRKTAETKGDRGWLNCIRLHSVGL